MKPNRFSQEIHFPYGKILTSINQGKKSVRTFLSKIVMVIVIGTVACNKGDKAITPAADRDGGTMAKFVEDFHSEVSEEKADAMIKRYKEFSAEELHEFYTLKNERDMKDYEELALAGKSNVSEQERARVREAAKALGEFRMELLAASIEKMGQPANRLTPGQYNTLSNEILKTRGHDLLQRSKSTAAQQNAVLACPTAYWGGHAIEVSSASVGWYGMWRIDNDANATFCDREYRFNGDFRYICGVKPTDKLAIDNISKRSIYYSDGYDTGVLLGYNTWLATVAPWELSANMRN